MQLLLTFMFYIDDRTVSLHMIRAILHFWCSIMYPITSMVGVLCHQLGVVSPAWLVCCAAIEVTRQMFNRAKSMKPSQWRNPNNLHFEALRCIVALQACKPSVATPFREEIVNCLRSSDASLRYLSADVLYNSCSADNLSSVAEQVRFAAV